MTSAAGPPADDAIQATLDAPGAGLPAVQAWALKAVFRTVARCRGWKASTAAFLSENARLCALTEPLGDADLARRVLIAPLFGIEDSSRFWSPAMVLEHLVISVNGIAGAMVALERGKVPPRQVSIADIKPRGAGEARAAIGQFRESMGRYAERFGAPVAGARRSRTHPHPWFGPLTIHDWHTLVAVHNAIHRRQVERILAAARPA
jgi:hypothetical protein